VINIITKTPSDKLVFPQAIAGSYSRNKGTFRSVVTGFFRLFMAATTPRKGIGKTTTTAPKT
jgi:hypothetical protein